VDNHHKGERKDPTNTTISIAMRGKRKKRVALAKKGGGEFSDFERELGKKLPRDFPWGCLRCTTLPEEEDNHRRVDEKERKDQRLRNG